MKEMQIKKKFELEANTLKEARSLLKGKIPKGMELLSEQVLSDGKRKSSKGVANTIEAAFEKAQSNIPSNAEITRKKKVSYPEEKTIYVEAFNEENAKKQAKREVGDTALVKRIKLIDTGRKGFLGIGKKPNRYEVHIFQQAVAEVTFKQKARLQATIGKRPKCERCGKSADYLLPVQLMAADSGARSKVLDVCDKCFTKFASGSKQIYLE